MARTVVVYVDDVATEIETGSTLLQACDAVGRYVPRLCHHPALRVGERLESDAGRCGLCVVRLADGSTTRACSTEVSEGVRIRTDDDELRRQREDRLASILARHPHFCLSCPDRYGCSRDTCSYDLAPEARCCDRLGSCELGQVVMAVDPHTVIPRREVAVSRLATTEGRIRREAGLCVSCGRCVRVCAAYEQAGKALEMADVARPKRGTLRESGCTFCGLCVLVCPTGALSAPGSAGQAWLSARREEGSLPAQVLPPGQRRVRLPEGAGNVPPVAGVMTLLDEGGRVLRIAGVPDLARGVTEALAEQCGGEATWLQFEVEPLYTQRESEMLQEFSREHGCLPEGNDLGDDLFADG